MAAFLVTGNPGSGKSTLAQELARRGLATIDPDYHPELSHWEDDAGKRVSRTEGPAAPDEQWLSAHRWVWNRSRLQDVLTQHQAPVFVCGIALNIDNFEELERVDRLVADGAAAVRVGVRINPQVGIGSIEAMSTFNHADGRRPADQNHTAAERRPRSR